MASQQFTAGVLEHLNDVNARTYEKHTPESWAALCQEVNDLERRVLAAADLEVLYHLATHQIPTGKNRGIWECGQVARRDSVTGEVEILESTRALALTPWEAVEAAAAKVREIRNNAQRTPGA